MNSESYLDQPKKKKALNAFFLYRKEYKMRIAEMYNTTKSHEISKIAGECWKEESAAVKAHFKKLSATIQGIDEPADRVQKATPIPKARKRAQILSSSMEQPRQTCLH